MLRALPAVVGDLRGKHARCTLRERQSCSDFAYVIGRIIVDFFCLQCLLLLSFVVVFVVAIASAVF